MLRKIIMTTMTALILSSGCAHFESGGMTRYEEEYAACMESSAYTRADAERDVRECMESGELMGGVFKHKYTREKCEEKVANFALEYHLSEEKIALDEEHCAGMADAKTGLQAPSPGPVLIPNMHGGYSVHNIY